MLKRGRKFSLVVSVPYGWRLKVLFVFYPKRILPLLGLAFLGNPENYRMLGVRAEEFGGCRRPGEVLGQQGLRVVYREYYFGCATGLRGIKP